MGTRLPSMVVESRISSSSVEPSPTLTDVVATPWASVSVDMTTSLSSKTLQTRKISPSGMSVSSASTISTFGLARNVSTSSSLRIRAPNIDSPESLTVTRTRSSKRGRSSPALL